MLNFEGSEKRQWLQLVVCKKAPGLLTQFLTILSTTTNQWKFHFKRSLILSRWTIWWNLCNQAPQHFYLCPSDSVYQGCGLLINPKKVAALISDIKLLYFSITINIHDSIKTIKIKVQKNTYLGIINQEFNTASSGLRGCFDLIVSGLEKHTTQQVPSHVDPNVAKSWLVHENMRHHVSPAEHRKKHKSLIFRLFFSPTNPTYCNFGQPELEQMASTIYILQGRTDMFFLNPGIYLYLFCLFKNFIVFFNYSEWLGCV